jgi:threonine/homoserine/homoserine lactone efflux protein
MFWVVFSSGRRYSAGTIGKWLTGRPQYARPFQRLAGVILIGLGMRLALAEK